MINQPITHTLEGLAWGLGSLALLCLITYGEQCHWDNIHYACTMAHMTGRL